METYSPNVLFILTCTTFQTLVNSCKQFRVAHRRAVGLAARYYCCGLTSGVLTQIDFQD